jgi:hypothetical protein
MVESYKNKKTTDIVGIANLISLLDEDDSWARIEVARYFNELCRKKEIQDYTKEVIDKIREALLTLTHDKNPEADDNIKSSNPRPDDAITRGINSVRGIATEALVAFCHYFPTDQTASKRLTELADDNTTAVKATLIYSLRYMIGKNFSLCEEIINKFRNRRDPEIDFALIHFFSQLDCEKFLQYQDFVKLLFNSTNEQISEDMGELVGYRYINGCDVQALLDEIIGNRKGTKHTLRRLQDRRQARHPLSGHQRRAGEGQARQRQDAGLEMRHHGVQDLGLPAQGRQSLPQVRRRLHRRQSGPGERRRRAREDHRRRQKTEKLEILDALAAT